MASLRVPGSILFELSLDALGSSVCRCHPSRLIRLRWLPGCSSSEPVSRRHLLSWSACLPQVVFRLSPDVQLVWPFAVESSRLFLFVLALLRVVRLPEVRPLQEWLLHLADIALIFRARTLPVFSCKPRCDAFALEIRMPGIPQSYLFLPKVLKLPTLVCH